jgi:hypothetical protein
VIDLSLSVTLEGNARCSQKLDDELHAQEDVCTGARLLRAFSIILHLPNRQPVHCWLIKAVKGTIEKYLVVGNKSEQVAA